MDPDAPFLFSEAELTECERYLPAVVDGRTDQDRFSGAIIEKQTRLVDAILADLAEGCSQRSIAEKFKVSRHTVSGILQRAEQSGKIAPFKQRVSAKLGQIAEEATEAYLEAIRERKIQPAQIPVGVGIMLDKKAALDGEASEIIEHRHTIDVDGWREKFKSAREKIQGSIQPETPDAITVESETVTDQST